MKIRLRFQAMQKLLLFVVLNFLFTSVLHAKTFVFLGDSLTEGYGVAQSASFPHLIQKKVSEDKLDWKIIGAGSSGSTSASALSRLKWIAKEKPDYVMILLGSNDGLRGFKVEEVEKNLFWVSCMCHRTMVQVTLENFQKFIPVWRKSTKWIWRLLF